MDYSHVQQQQAEDRGAVVPHNHPEWECEADDDLIGILLFVRSGHAQTSAEKHKHKVYKIDRVTEEVKSETSRLDRMVAEARAETDPLRKQDLLREIQESLLGMLHFFSIPPLGR